MIKLIGEVRDVKTNISQKNGKTYTTLLVDVGSAYPVKLNWNIEGKPVPKLKDKIDIEVKAFGQYWDDEKKKFYTANVIYSLNS